jgi:SAM-dependent methyltransferase
VRADSGDEISRFYDQHPYPPPVDDLDHEVEAWSDGARRRVEHARLWPSLPYRDDHSILVAGCGTSQAARYAVRYPGARIVGIDVSPTSLDATRHLAQRHQLANLELYQLPIEQAATLGRSFDHIVSTGVLHHLADPAEGLLALRDALAPEGAMRLMVYGRFGRYGVNLMNEYCQRLDVTPTPGEIADLISTLRELLAGHPISHVLRDTPDFRDDDALADALLNPREQSYSVPDLVRLIERAGMRFGRWVRQAPYRPQCGALTEVAHGQRIAAMSDGNQFAAVELFRGTIQRHSAVLYRKDSPLPAQPVGWDGDGWRGFVPIRPTTVVMVEERLPTGVAAALINRAHVDRDLVFFADADEKRVFEAIDGERSIAEIPGASAELLRRLWWHDLVLLDTSRPAQD